MKKGLIITAFLALVAFAGFTVAEQGDYATLGYYSTGGHSFWRVNSSGNFIPGADGTYSIGDATYGASAVYTADLTVSDDLAVTDDASVTGKLTVTEQLLIPAMSSTTIAATTPAAVGSIVYNTTRFAICVGTSTAGPYWIFQSSNPITIAGVSCVE